MIYRRSHIDTVSDGPSPRLSDTGGQNNISHRHILDLSGHICIWHGAICFLAADTL